MKKRGMWILVLSKLKEKKKIKIRLGQCRGRQMSWQGISHYNDWSEERSAFLVFNTYASFKTTEHHLHFAI